jgi:hypothetical protein
LTVAGAMEKLKKNKSAITQIEVHLREIDRLFDTLCNDSGIPQYRFVAMDASRNPRVVVQDPSRLLFHEWSLSDENGDSIRGDVYYFPGQYRFVRSTDAPYLLWHTFSPLKSRAIDGKYVYVWMADAKDGSGLQLAHELYFAGGQFQFIDANSQDRSPKGSTHETLILDLISFTNGKPQQRFYFFLLARFQIPSKRLEEIKKDVPTRAMRLFDEFYTYIVRDPVKKKPEPIGKIQREKKDLPVKLSFLVNLIDPFREALSRNERYKNSLHRWQEAQGKMGNDPAYLLAKRIESLTERDDSLKDNLAYSFRDYLNGAEEESRRRYFVTLSMANELIRWIGRKEKREAFNFKGKSSDTWFHNGKDMTPSSEDKGEEKWHNLYYQACLDYKDAADEICSKVADLHGEIMDQLEQSANGEAWLEELVSKGVEGKLPELESGLTEFFFESGRKGSEFSQQVSSRLLRVLGPSWVAHYRGNSLKNLNDWVKSKFGAELKEVEAGFTAKKWGRVRAKQERDLGRARKRVVTKLDSSSWASVTRKGLYLRAGIEVVNFCYALEKVREHRDDPWAYLECLGSALDTYTAVHEVGQKIEYFREIGEVAEAGSWAKRFIKVGVCSALIDVITGAHDMYESDSVSAMVANGMRTAGAGLVIGGEAAEEHPVGWIATIVGVALESGGSYLRAETRAACVFLRHCRWGKGASTFDSVVARVSDENSYWYKGKLAALAADVKQQHKCLDELIYNYEPEMEFESAEHDCTLKIKVKTKVAVLGPGAKWNLNIQISKSPSGFDGGSTETRSFVPTDEFDDTNLTAGDWYATSIFDSQEGKLSMRFQVALHAKVDVFGDGTHVIERECSGQYYFAQKIEDLPSGGVPNPTPTDAGVPDAGFNTGGAPSGGVP